VSPAIALDDAVPRPDRARIDAEDDQGPEG
jgi:hypothetical protein